MQKYDKNKCITSCAAKQYTKPVLAVPQLAG